MYKIPPFSSIILWRIIGNKYGIHAMPYYFLKCPQPSLTQVMLYTDRITAWVKLVGAEIGIYWSNCVNTMAADDLAPCVARTSAAMVLNELHQWILVYYNNCFIHHCHLSVENDIKWNYTFKFLKNKFSTTRIKSSLPEPRWRLQTMTPRLFFLMKLYQSNDIRYWLLQL